MMERNYLQLNQIAAYTKAFHLSTDIWELVFHWNNFVKYKIGQQFINAVDAISANIAECFGSYHKKDKVKFYYDSFGPVKECLDWNEKAEVRTLIAEEIDQKVCSVLELLPKETHQFIKYTNERLKI